jgi:hypothetical protein
MDKRQAGQNPPREISGSATSHIVASPVDLLQPIQHAKRRHALEKDAGDLSGAR